MEYRILGKTGYQVSAISLGTWQVGGRWGDPFNEKNAEAILHTAIDRGVNFIDTADVYSDGLSEKVVGKVVRERKEKVYVATKCGRRLSPHTADAYQPAAIVRFVEDSLANTGLETLDLIQLHCPPTPVYEREDIFACLDQLKAEGKIQHYGVSVELVDEALEAITYPGVATVQIIFNMFRLKPAELFFEKAQAAQVGILARVPLASGLLTGKMKPDTQFGKDDHRAFNREGKFFDKGETFSGIDFNQGIEAAEVLKTALGTDQLTAAALRYTLMFDAVSCVIPGASNHAQAEANIAAMDYPTFTPEQMEAVQQIYTQYFRKQIHHLW